MPDMTLDILFSRAIPEPNSGCLLWEGAENGVGYGVFGRGGRKFYAHRVSYQLANNIEYLIGVHICHKCDTPSCINPDHLFAGSRSDNMKDASSKGRLKGPGLFGVRCHAAKLTDSDIVAIRNDTRSCLAISRDYPVSNVMIGLIKKRAWWKNIP